MRSHLRRDRINSTGNATDVALNGNGFFVIGNGAGGYELTRATATLRRTRTAIWLPNGMSVMGYPGREWSGEYERAADGDQHSVVGAGAATESDDDDEHDGEPGFGDRRRYAVSRGGDGVRLVWVSRMWRRLRASLGRLRIHGHIRWRLPAADYSAAGGNAAPAPITGTHDLRSEWQLDPGAANGRREPFECGNGGRRCAVDCA